MTERFAASLALASDPACFRQAREWLAGLAGRAGLDDGATHDLLVALSEACTNAHRHGYAGRRDGRIEVEVRGGAQTLELRVRDFGCRFDPEGVPEPLFDEPGEGGYGLFLMRNLMDDVTFAVDGEGTEVVMVKRLAASAPGTAEGGGD